MQLETLMLRSLGIACVVVCALVLGAMLVGNPAGPVGTTLAAAPSITSACPTPPDAVLCVRPASRG